MAARQRPPHRLGWPWTPFQVESADEQFFELYKRLSALELLVANGTSTAGASSAAPTSTVIGDASSLIIGACCEAEAWPLLVVPTPVLYTPGSVLFAGASGAPSQNNANFFWDITNARLGLGTTSPSYTLDVAGTIRANTGIGGVALRIGNADAIRVNSASGGVLYIDAADDLTGTINIRAGIITLSGVVGVAGLSSSSDINVTGGLFGIQITAAGIISYRLNGSAAGSKNWAFETTRTAAAGALEITNLTDALGSPRMVILAGGNVGIGTVAPGALLDVAGISRAKVNSLPATGAAATAGQSTLVAGTVTVNTTAMTATALLFLTPKTAGGVIGTYTYTQVNGVSFTINSSNALDTSVVNWHIIETH